jgi:aspartate aminotransferase
MASFRLNPMIETLQEAKTAALFSRVSDMKSRGETVNGALCVGQPDFPPPPEAIAATGEAATKGQTAYTAVPGTLELRTALCEYLKEQKGLTYNAEEILVTCGGKQAIYQVMMSLCQAGDEVIVPAPYWTSYPSIVGLSGAKTVMLETTKEDGYAITPEKLAAAITPKTRILIVCNPSNPTGCVMDERQCEKLAAVLRKPENEHVLVLSDEIYDRICFDGIKHVSFAALAGMKDRTLIINGFAKAFSMTGYRLGYLAGPKPVVKASLKLMMQITSCSSSISQYAGIAALKSPASWIDTQVKELKGKRDLALKLLLDIPEVSCPKPNGAFYLFPDISAYFGRETESGKVIANANDFCDQLLDEYRVALVTGDAFGNANCVRLSYAATVENINDALSKFGMCLKGLRQAKKNRAS